MNQPATNPSPTDPIAGQTPGFFVGADLDNDKRIDEADVTFQDGTQKRGKHYRVPSRTPGVSLETVVTGVHVAPQTYDPAKLIEENNLDWQIRFDDMVSKAKARLQEMEARARAAAKAALDAEKAKKEADDKAEVAIKGALSMKVKFWFAFGGSVLIFMFYARELFWPAPPTVVTDVVSVENKAAIAKAKEEAVAEAKKAWRARAGAFLESIKWQLDDPTLPFDDYDRGRKELELDE